MYYCIIVLLYYRIIALLLLFIKPSVKFLDIYLTPEAWKQIFALICISGTSLQAALVPHSCSGNQILQICEPPSARLYPALVTALHRTGCDRIPHSTGTRSTEGNRIPHCIPYRLRNVPESYCTRENNS